MKSNIKSKIRARNKILICFNCGSDAIIHNRCLECLLSQRQNRIVVVDDNDSKEPGIHEEDRKDNNFPRPLPPYPTDALPGSQAKIEIMSKRWFDGFQIFHPLDATMNGKPEQESQDDDYFLIPDEPIISSGPYIRNYRETI